MANLQVNTEDAELHLVALPDGAVVEAEEADEPIQEFADVEGGSFHGAAQRLAGNVETHPNVTHPGGTA